MWALTWEFVLVVDGEDRADWRLAGGDASSVDEPGDVAAGGGGLDEGVHGVA
jgi:hypothetical protein